MDLRSIFENIDKLYAAAMGELDWTEVLTAMADALDSEAGTLEVHDVERAKLVHFESVRLDLDNIRTYGHEFAWNNPRMSFMRRHSPGQIGYDQLFITESEMDRDPFYQELLAPSGLRYFLSTHTPILDGRVFLLISFQRSGRVRGIEPELLSAMRLLQPHVSRALRLYWTLIRDRVDPGRFDRILAGFGLTPAERQLALALTLGDSLPAFARRVGISMNTAYSHYRKIKSKLDCAKQTELLARLHALQNNPVFGTED